MNRTDPEWPELGAVPPASLVDARLELHWAAQLLAAFGQNFVEPRPDDSHRSLEWHGDGFLSQPANAGPILRLGLRVADLRLAVLDEDLRVVSKTSLQGTTLDEAYDWTAEAVADAAEGPPPRIQRPEYDMPEHAVSGGGRFAAGGSSELAELRRWYQVAHRALTELVAGEPAASPVRCWPHHFDIATLMSFGAPPGGEDRFVGVGMSPGDDYYPEPYWYVNHHPATAEAELPGLSHGGRWHREDWTGSVLTGTDLVAGEGREEQANRLRGYLASAVGANRSLAG